MEPKTYTLEQIHAAFLAEFHESGEQWFPYNVAKEEPYKSINKRENMEVTDAYWNDFLEHLLEIAEKVGSDVKSPQ